MKLKIFFTMLCILLVQQNIVYAKSEPWKEHKGRHFVIYYKKARFDFVQTVEKAAEQYYVEITKNLGLVRSQSWVWKDRSKIYVFDDSEDYVTSGRQAGWSSGAASPRAKTIRTFPAAHGFFDSTLPHELGHIIFREFVGYNVQIPSWFEEGVAMYQEKAKRWGAHDTVRKAIKDDTFLSLSELSLNRLRHKSSQGEVNLFYAESASVVNYLITEFGDRHFTHLCRKLKSGIRFDWAMGEVYVRFKNINDLNKAWVNYLENE